MFNEMNFSPDKKNENNGENLRAEGQTKSEMDGTTYYDQNDDQWGQPMDESTGKSYEELNSGVGEDMVHVTEKGIEDLNPNIEGVGDDDDPAAQLLRDAGINPETGEML